jgi:glycosyltransferase involved in cell wall biosynthesis
LKVFPTLHKACNLLIKDRSDFQILLTTKSEFRENYIHSVGWLSQDDLARLYSEVDICVVPSVWPEPFGIVALESMSAGKPVIITNVGGLKNIVVDGESGFVIQPGDAAALKDRLVQLFDNPLLRDSMGKKGRERVISYFEWNRIYSDYYKNLFYLP